MLTRGQSISPEFLDPSVAYVTAGGETGTAYLVSGDRLVTCKHVVKSLAIEGRLTFKFVIGGAEEGIATLKKVHPTADCAVLQLERSLIHQRAPLEVTAERPTFQQRWDGYGFPGALGGQPHPLSGQVLRSEWMEHPWDLVQLECEQARSGRVPGWSGSPLVVTAGGSRKVFGHLAAFIKGFDDPQTAQFGTVFACPGRYVLELLSEGQVAPSAPSAPSASKVTSYEIEHRYLRRLKPEQHAANVLLENTPLVLTAPASFGKSSVARFLFSEEGKALYLSALASRYPGGIEAHTLDLSAYPGGTSSSTLYHALLRELSKNHAGRETQVADIVRSRTHTTGRGSGKKTHIELGSDVLTDLLRYMLSEDPTRLFVLIVERAESTLEWDDNLRESFNTWLRDTVQDDTSRRLENVRVVAIASTSKALQNGSVFFSPFPSVLAVVVPEFTAEEILRLASLSELAAWSDDDARQIRALVGGHPDLVCLAIAAARREGPLTSAQMVLPSLNDLTFPPFQAHLKQCNELLKKERNREIYDRFIVLCRLCSGPQTQATAATDAPLGDPATAEILEAAGLVVHVAGNRYRPTNALYRVYFSRQRKSDEAA